MSKFTRYLVATLLLTTLQVHANPIFYEVSHDTGNRYEYHYTVVNETSEPIDWFTIYFDLGLYENLSITANPNPNWNGLAIGVLDPFLQDGRLRRLVVPSTSHSSASPSEELIRFSR